MSLCIDTTPSPFMLTLDVQSFPKPYVSLLSKNTTTQPQKNKEEEEGTQTEQFWQQLVSPRRTGAESKVRGIFNTPEGLFFVQQ